jgi:glycosyltransferase involved in cell wall biosynthesis
MGKLVESPMRLCLNMIVKNESARIVRALASVAPHISCYVIADTGSTDDTVELIRAFFAATASEAKFAIPGEIVHCKFKDFSQARNKALFAAQKSKLEFDYILLMDADMELKIVDPTWVDDIKGAPAYDMYQVAGALHYQNRRLVKRGEQNGYLGVTHEYLNVETGGCLPAAKAFFYDHADGANRPEKFKRDIALLKDGLKEEPKNERYMYYLAQSYRDAGKPEKAEKWYRRRIAAGGWDEEVWSAQYMVGHCRKDQGDEAGFIRESQIAYNMRPSRAEPLYDMARYFRDKGENATSLLYSEASIQIPTSKDALFVNDFVYTVGCLEEYSICAFYVPNRQAAGYKTTNMLTLKKTPYTAARELARVNMYHYVPPLKNMCPSFEWKPIAFVPPKDYVAMNPSICMSMNSKAERSWHAIIRTVNYRIDDQGRYIIKATDGTANSTNPIHTRNFYVEFDENLDINPAMTMEILAPGAMPKPLFDLVIGFEDMRLYPVDDSFWASATIRELTPEGYCEQVRVKLGFPDDEKVVRLHAMTRMLRRGHEKNWMPILNQAHDFMYRTDEVVDGNGNVKVHHEALVATDALAGSSQVIRVKDGWLGVVHEARQIPGAPTRYYIHRFVAWDMDFKLKKVSAPFYFHEKCIEYVAGLTYAPDQEKLLLSYGFKDSEPRLATVDVVDVERFLWAS